MAYDRYDRPRDNRFRDDRPRDDDRYSSGRDGGGRGFFERAGDEISSWFGDEDAERRREQDDRNRGYAREDRPRSDRGWFSGSNDRSRERSSWFGDSNRDDERWSSRPQYDRDRFQDRGRRDYGSQEYASSQGDDYRGSLGGLGGADERFGRSDYRQSGGAFSGTSRSHGGYGAQQQHDPHYSEWRQRQISQLDQDYDDYRREHQSKFDNEFTGWRSQRQSKRQLLGQVREHADVVGSDDQPVGKVDKVQGDKIILTRDSQGGIHKSFNLNLIDRVDDDRVILTQAADQARRELREERNFDERNSGDQRGFIGRDERGQHGGDGPHVLERSFSGTYPGEGR